MCTPYENREGWKVAVSYFDETWYLCEYEADQAADDDFKNSERQKEMTYWGFKFESYITSGTDCCILFACWLKHMLTYMDNLLYARPHAT
jgi:hypothetical protein